MSGANSDRISTFLSIITVQRKLLVLNELVTTGTHCIIGSDQIVIDGKDSLDAVAYKIWIAFLTEEFLFLFHCSLTMWSDSRCTVSSQSSEKFHNPAIWDAQKKQFLLDGLTTLQMKYSQNTFIWITSESQDTACSPWFKALSLDHQHIACSTAFPLVFNEINFSPNTTERNLVTTKCLLLKPWLK